MDSFDLAQIENITLRERVYRSLRQLISTGQFLPGQRVSLSALAEQLGVSIAPVREALLILENEDAITRQNRRYYQVGALSLEQLEEIYEIRRRLETYLGEHACLLRLDSSITAVEQSYQALVHESEDLHSYRLRNQKFHFEIYRFANKPIVMEFISKLWARIGPYVPSPELPLTESASSKMHFGMLQAFREGNPQAMIDHLSSDMESAYVKLRRSFESRGSSVAL